MARDELVFEKIASVIAEASYMEEMEKVGYTDYLNYINDPVTMGMVGDSAKADTGIYENILVNGVPSASKLKKLRGKIIRTMGNIPKKKKVLAGIGLGAAGILTGGAQINKRIQAKRSAKAAQAAIDAKPINRILSRAKGLGSKAEKYISRVPKKYRALATVGIGGAAGFGGYEALKNRGNE